MFPMRLLNERFRIRRLLAVGLISAAAAACAVEREHIIAEVERLVLDVESGRITPGDRVRVTGIVTDVDAERQLAFIGDDNRAMAVQTARGGLAARRGQRVTLEARVELHQGRPLLAEPFVIEVSDAPSEPPFRDVDRVFDPTAIGRRVELDARVQGASLEAGRLHLAMTSAGMHFQAEIRRPEGNDGHALLGEYLRISGVVLPPDAADRDPSRISVASFADIETIGSRGGSDRPLERLTNAAAVLALSGEEAAAGRPVVFRGQVTVHDPAWTILFVQDDTAGVFVLTQSLSHAMPDCRPGDVVDILGETGPGDFAPIVAAHRLTIRGRGALPRARPVDLEALLSGAHDSQLVEVRAVVRGIGTDESRHVVIELAHARERISAYLPPAPSQAFPDGFGVDALVRVRAVAATRFTARRQLAGVALWLPGADQILIQQRAPDDPFQVPARPVRSLLTFDRAHRASRLARVRGVVLLAHGPVLYLRDESGTVEMHTREPASVRPGDLVDGVGFPSPGEYGPVLEDARLQTIGRAELPHPLNAHAGDLRNPASGPELVRIRGRLVERFARAADDVLVVESGGTRLTAVVPRSSELAAVPTFEEGATLELTGIPAAQTVRMGSRLEPPDVRLLLGSGDAVRVIQSSSGLLARRSTWLAATPWAIAAIALCSIVVQRRRVRLQVRRELLTTLSDAIAQPLHEVLGRSRLLLDGSPAPDGRRHLPAIESAAEAALHIIDGMAAQAGIQARPRPCDRHPVSLRELVNGAMGVLGPQAGEQGVVLTYEIAADVPDRVLVDERRVRDVVLYLVGSAILAPDARQLSMAVGVRSRASAEPARSNREVEPGPCDPDACELVFTLAGSGISLPEDRLSTLFEAFTATGPTAAGRTSRTELDLARAARLVATMGGWLTLTAECERRGLLTFGFPVLTAARTESGRGSADASTRACA